MSVSDTNLKAMVVAEVGDLNSIVATNIDTIWAMFARFSTTAPQLQYLYAKRQALSLLMGQVREQVSFEEFANVKVALSDKLKGLLAMRAEVTAEIVAEEKRARGTRTGAIAPIAAVAPTSQPDAAAAAAAAAILPTDGNDPRYRGTVYVQPLVTR